MQHSRGFCFPYLKPDQHISVCRRPLNQFIAMTRRMKDRTEIVVFTAAMLPGRLAATPFNCLTTASGDRFETPAFLTISV
jgi:hypothetical protein